MGKEGFDNSPAVFDDVERDEDCGVFDLPKIETGQETDGLDESTLSFEEVVEEMEQLEDETTDQQELDYKKSPVDRLVKMILTDALKRDASSILVEGRQNDFVVRYRLDGVLYEIMRPPLRFKEAILARIKILAGIDLLRKKMPQRGTVDYSARLRFQAKLAVTIIPTTYGENAVLQIHKVPNNYLQRKWQLPDNQVRQLQEVVEKKNGLILVVGSSNEERQRLLGNIATFISSPNLSIYSFCNQPLVFPIPGVNEILIKPEMDFGLTKAVKDVADQDSDAVISFVTPWQKEEMTALLETALSGKLVVAPFPTDSAAATLGRLVGLGISPLLISSALTLICTSRTVRQLCDHCKIQENQSLDELIKSGCSPEQAQQPQPQKGLGCGFCFGLGYHGRLRFYEFFPVFEEIKQAILEGENSAWITELALKQGLYSLRQAGLAKVSQQLTTLEEILRVT